MVLVLAKIFKFKELQAWFENKLNSTQTLSPSKVGDLIGTFRVLQQIMKVAKFLN